MKCSLLLKVTLLLTFLTLNSMPLSAAKFPPPEDPENPECLPWAPCGPNPKAPTNVAVPSTSATGSYSLTWSGGTLGSYFIIDERKNGGAYYNITTTSGFNVVSHNFAKQLNGLFSYRIKNCETENRVEYCSTWAYSGNIDVKNKPATPAAPTKIDSTSTSYTVSWSKPFGTVTYYDVQEKIGSGSWSTVSSSQPGTTLSRSGKSNNTTYYYRVRACNQYSWSCSSYGSQNTVRVELKPSTPAKPANVNSTSTSVTVNWSKPSGTVNFYQVQERVAGGSWSTVASNNTSTSLTRTGRVNGTNYEYRLRACNSYSWSCSGYSSANSAKVRLKPSTPAAPSRPSTSTGSASVTWIKPAGSVTYYDLQKRNNNGSWVTAKAGDTNTSETVSGLTDGSWDFRVRACHGYSWACSGYSSASSDTTVRLKPSTPPAPTGPTSDTNGAYTINWTKPSGEVTVYDVIEYKNSTSSYSTVANDTSALSLALSGRGDGNYTYRVRACNGYSWACSAYSSHSASLIVGFKPGMPASISNPATDTDGTIAINWGTASGSVSDYRLEEQKNGGSWVQVQSGSTGLSKTRAVGNGTYHYRVRACNNFGCSSFRSTIALTEVRIKPSTPAAPTGPSTSTGSAATNWSSVTNATYYDLQKRNNNGSWVNARTGDTNTSDTVHGLTDGSWDFRVRACNTHSWSCSSYSAASADTLVRQLPSIPSISEPSGNTDSDGQFALAWSTATGATYYDLQERKNSSNWTTIYSAQSTSFSINASSDGLYEYRVKACNSFNWSCSGYSATKSVTVEIVSEETPEYAATGAANIPDVTLIETAPTESDLVGSIEGSASVSGGAATYSIPIVVPPGRAGMQPQVSLNYSSRSSNGNAGVGWNLSAISSVSRCGKTFAQDGETKGVTYSQADDRLCFSGQRLIKTNSGTYGSSGSIYKTELDTFSRITQLEGDINDTATRFKVERKNGRVEYYGWSSQSREVAEGKTETLSWLLEKVEDRTTNKNNMTYQYLSNGNGEFLLSSIKYTGDKSSDGNREVVVEYQPRSDVSSKYLSGGLTKDSQVVANIKTFVGSTTVRNYKLEYQTSSASGRDILESVTGCGFESGVEKCLPSTTFSWLQSEPTFELQKTGYKENGVLVEQLQAYSQIDTVAPRADINGDGVLDWRFWFQNAEGELISQHDNLVRGCALNPYNFRNNCSAADFNTDGKSDFFRTNSTSLELAYSDGETASTYFDSGIPWGIDTYEALRYINDFNGDGLPDVVIERSQTYRGKPLAGRLYLYLHNGNFDEPYSNNGQTIYTFSTSGSNPSNGQRISSVQFMGDMNGDRIPDFIESTTLDVAEDYNTEVPFIQPKPINLVYVQKSANDTFSTQSLDISSPGSGLGDERIFVNLFIDINNDGLTDWIDSPNSYRLNTGDGFANSELMGGSWRIPTRTLPRVSSTGAPEIIEFDRWFKYAGSSFQTDYDNDGDIDFIVPTGYVVESCAMVRVGFSGTLTEICGDDLYEPIEAQSQTYSLTTIDTTLYDRGVFSYSVVKFEEGEDGRIAFNTYPTSIIGTANQTRAVDGFGNGLTDYVFIYGDCVGVGNVDCRFRNITAPMTGVEAGVYIQRNRGSASGDDYRPQDVISSVENGLGVTDEWVLKPLSSEAYGTASEPFYQAENGYLATQSSNVQKQYFNFASNNYVVAEHKISSGVSSGGVELFNSTFYRYKEALYNREGRGFMGFRSIIMDSPAYLDSMGAVQNYRTVSNFHQIYPLTGKLENVATCFADEGDMCGNQPIQLNEYDYHEIVTASSSVGSLASLWLLNTRDETTLVSVDDRSQVKSNKKLTTLQADVDLYGNILKQTSVVNTGTGLITKIVDREFDLDSVDEWWTNKLSTQTTTHQVLSGTVPSYYQAALDSQKTIQKSYAYDSTSRKVNSVTTSATEGGGITSKITTAYAGAAGDYGLPTKVTTTSNDESRYVKTEYSDDFYFVDKVINSLGHTTSSTTSTLFGQPLTTTDANANVTTNQFDALGRIKQTSSNFAPITYIRVYDCAASCSSTDAVYKEVREQAGTAKVTVEKDKFGRSLLSETPAFESGETIYTYTTLNRLGQKLFNSAPSYNSSTDSGTHFLEYDILGRLVYRETDTAGGDLTVRYDYEAVNPYSNYGDQFQTKITVNNTQVLYRTHNGIQQMVETTDASGGVTSYAYDNLSNPTVIRDAKGSEVTATYNALGQKLWVKDPNMGNKTFTYSGFGEVKSETDANGNTYRYEYDVLGRLDERFLNNSLEASFSFDSALQGNTGSCVGLPASEASNNGNSFSRSYQYDQFCRPTDTLTTIDGETFTTSTHYDANFGRVKGTTYPTGITVENWYNSDGYLTHQVNAASDYVYHEVVSMNEVDSVLTQTALKANGILTEVQETYVNSGQMKAIYTHSSVGSNQRHRIDYTYDAYGNLSRQNVETQQATGVVLSEENYDYDDLHRLNWSDLTVNGTTNRINYAYDSVGNLTLKGDYANSYSYGDINRGNGNAGPNAVHQITSVNGDTISFDYDNNGNLLSGDGKVLSYNAFNKPLTVSKNGVTSNFYYGSDQMRYKQVKTPRPNGVETTLYVGGYQEIRYGSKVIKKSYIGDTIVTETVENNASKFQAGFVHRDRLNSVVTVTDDLGNVIDNKSFDPFGKPREASMESVNPARLDQVAWTQGFISSVEATDLPTRQGFTGHEHMDDAELVHMNGRIYDYNLGRFLSVDPFIQAAANSQSMNPYSYIMNNPLSGTDPSGYISQRRDFLAEAFGVDSPFGYGSDKKPGQLCDPDKKGCTPKGMPEECSTGDLVCYAQFARAKGDLSKFIEYALAAGGLNGTNIKQPFEQAQETSGSENGLEWELPSVYDYYSSFLSEFNTENIEEDVSTVLNRMVDDAWSGLRSKRNWKNVYRELMRMADASPMGATRAQLIKAPGFISRMLAKLSKGCSFSAETLVSTPDGFKPISELKEGDLVYARDDETGEYGIKPINAIFVEKHDDVIELEFDTGILFDEEVTTTAEHPFRVFGKGWTPAAELNSGDLIETLDRKFVRLEEVLITKEPQLAYNFEVDGFHTYSVTESKLWVHNTCAQLHHLIPKAVFNEFKHLFDNKYLRDHAKNLLKLPTPFHGNHPSYSNYVRSRLNDMLEQGPLTMQRLTSLQKELRKDLDALKKSGAYERLNHYYKELGY